MADITLQSESVPATSLKKWRRRFARYLDRLEQQEAWDRDQLQPANDTWEQRPKRGNADLTQWLERARAERRLDEAQGEFDRRVWRKSDALRLMLLTPAPDLDALACKLEASVTDEIEGLDAAAEYLAAMRDDARRLADEGLCLDAILSLPRPLLADLAERAIERLDETDGDPDVELNGDERDMAYVTEDSGRIHWQNIGSEDDERDSATF
jgi:hypothetical protein